MYWCSRHPTSNKVKIIEKTMTHIAKRARFYPKCLGLRVIGGGFNSSIGGIDSSFGGLDCDVSTVILTLAVTRLGV